MHDNAAGFSVLSPTPDDRADIFGEMIEEYIRKNTIYADINQNVSIGERIYNVDFEIDAENVDVGFVQNMAFFDHYSGYGFAPVTVLIHGIQVDAENFKTMGKNSLSWKVIDEDNGVSYVKFKIDKNTDELIQKIDDIDWDSESDYGELIDGFGKVYLIDAICTFGINVYKGEAHAQAIVKDYDLVGIKEKEVTETEDWDLDLDF